MVNLIRCVDCGKEYDTHKSSCPEHPEDDLTSYNKIYYEKD